MTQHEGLIVAKLHAVMVAVDHVGKDGRNTQQNYAFRGVDHLVNALGPEFRTHGIVPLPTLVSAEYDGVQGRSGPMRQATVVMAYTFVAVEDGSSVTVSMPGESLDVGDKAMTKALSQAWKYVLAQTFAIPTQEPDPDGDSYERANAPTDDEISQAEGYEDRADDNARHADAEARAKRIPAEKRQPLRDYRKANGWPMSAAKLSGFLDLIDSIEAEGSDAEA